MARYWFCVKHHAVESGPDMCPPIDRLGPYDSEADAERALEKAQKRNEEWDNDPEWTDETDWAGLPKRRRPE
jgi:hypothetical protein